MMGCDIHIRVQDKDGNDLCGDGWSDTPFRYRDYGMFGFLADVRNYSMVPPISAPRGLPSDWEGEEGDDCYCYGDHNHSWLSIKELVGFDYDAKFENRRVTIDGNGGCTAPVGGGKMTTYREFLGPGFFDDLNTLVDIKADRVVFWFDD